MFKLASFSGQGYGILPLQWPFVRILGVQEPASMLFSVLNAATILYGFICFRRRARPEYPYLTMAWVQFIVSAVSHTWMFEWHCHSITGYMQAFQSVYLH